MTEIEGAKPRLILLTQWFDPEPAPKGLSFAQKLVEAGFAVEVITGFPNYPGGQVYDGYRIRPIQRERSGEIDITRLALYPSHDRNRLGRILNYVSFFLTSLIYLGFRARRSDVIYAYHPPLTVGMTAVVTRLLRGTPIVLDVQDLWPDTLRATGMVSNEKILRIVDAFCRWTWRRADHIAVLSEGFARLLASRGIPEEKISVIYNWAAEAEKDLPEATLPPNALADGDRFRVLFAGNMGPAQALDSVLQSASIVAERGAAVDFCFLGSGIEEERLKQLAREMGLTNTIFLPRVPVAEVGAWMNAADCLLVHLKCDPLFSVTIPSKTQAYLAAGKPVIMAAEGDAAELVKKSAGGMVVPPEQPTALADAVIELSKMSPEDLARLGRNSRYFYEQELSFVNGVNKFVALLKDVMLKSR